MTDIDNPAEAMRRAAALMRERVEAATPGPWLGVMGMFKDGEWPCVIAAQGDRKDAQTWLLGAGNGGSAREGNATHAGSWHPLVALAVADWLEFEAVNAPGPGEVYLRGGRVAYALAVACAYLGEAES